MVKLRPREAPSFTDAEIEQMKKLLKEVGEESLSEDFCEKLSRKFSREVGREGKPAIHWTQVQDWFQDKQQEVFTSPNSSTAKSEPERSPISKGEKLLDISDWEFEARSSKEGAWYDVAVFLTHRVLSSGEPEVRVRFAGFGSEEDEWVNVKRGVRERSIPLEPSECQKVEVGDLVLCFQEREDQAIYFDAHVLEIQRRLHDIRGCRCLFLVCYDHNGVEENVYLRRLCRRP
ncbi:hypothetical protein GIB67_017267 [Kingdonia uniflora]|uniref:SAWADEE domain-containing protein n=1 Tax=Kingdonia uniflora TaxID=39325 RepID=A0A7J7N353_9MAGN|nr:hypothetical protein GIB67_017267 [Kingdonia uniflora]